MTQDPTPWLPITIELETYRDGSDLKFRAAAYNFPRNHNGISTCESFEYTNDPLVLLEHAVATIDALKEKIQKELSR